MPPLAAHLVSDRGFYSHHGLYVGDGKVIHYSGLSDGLSAGPVCRTTLEDFCNGKGYSVRPHSSAKLEPEEIVHRAESRLEESKYNLAFNNCEHFVNWCIDKQNSSEQVTTVVKWSVNAGRSAVSVLKTGPGPAVATSAAECGKSLKAYLAGDISGEKLLEDMSSSVISTSAMTYYAGLGQMAIPVPVAGALIGAGIGLFVGSTLNQSGLLALGEAPVVAAARRRREEIEELCEKLATSIRESRLELEKQLDIHFGRQASVLAQQFDLLATTEVADVDKHTQALETIAGEMNVALQFSGFSEFKTFMASDEAFEL
jgi:hypothetical protein